MRSMYLKSFALLIVVRSTSAMVSGQTDVDTLNSHLFDQPFIVKIEGLRVLRGVLFKSVEVHIQDGVIQKRMFSTKADTDDVSNPGDNARVAKIEAANEKKNDFLRITIAAADVPTVPVPFVFRKGKSCRVDARETLTCTEQAEPPQAERRNPPKEEFVTFSRRPEPYPAAASPVGRRSS